MTRRVFAAFAILLLLPAAGSPAGTQVDGDQGQEVEDDSTASGEPADRFAAEDIELFERRIRPLLAERCYACHSEQAETVEAGLYLDRRSGLVDGGDSGPAIDLDDPQASLLLDAVQFRTLEMPPDEKLPEEQIEFLRRWLAMGAPWSPESPVGGVSETAAWDFGAIAETHWAWGAVRRPPLPEVRDSGWAQQDIDYFILARLERAGLPPAPRAEPRVLVRRIYLDLVGLPPAPRDVEAFVLEAERDYQVAVSRLVDNLLASPHYGERWGRHWLDVARYSDGHGGFLDNAPLPHAWRYRDWVVDAINRDVPYDRFVALQIAGDLMGGYDDAVATGFLALGPTYRSDGGDPESEAQARIETLDDRLDTLGRGLMGLTLACARCHDHKFDPIPQLDYYSLAGVFQNTGAHELPLAPAGAVEAYNEYRSAVGELRGKIGELRKLAEDQQRELTDEEQQRLEAWQAELERRNADPPPEYPRAHALIDRGDQDMHVALRGDLRKPGEQAPRRFLRLLSGTDPVRFTEGSGRLELARHVADPANPLTARVMVNRIWHHHFGRAVVRTPSNFGSLGRLPTHPDLLDFLASEFIDSGWSMADLHRRIMNSAAYQMSSRFDEKAWSIDGDNELIWRMNPRRMDVESWRDAMLSVTGELETSVGGPPVDDITRSRRRTLYARVSRNGDQFASDAFLQQFDFPLMRATVAKRQVSIVPQQYLFLLNSEFMVQRARALVARLRREASTDRERIERAYQLLYGRAPRAAELRLGLDFLQTTAEGGGELASWEQYAQVLLAANEFFFVR